MVLLLHRRSQRMRSQYVPLLGELMRVRELTIEEAWLYMPKPLKSLIRFLGMLMGAVVIVLCAI